MIAWERYLLFLLYEKTGAAVRLRPVEYVCFVHYNQACEDILPPNIMCATLDSVIY